MSTHGTGDARTGEQQATLLFKGRLHKIVCMSSPTSCSTSSSTSPSPTSWFAEDFTDGALLTNVEYLHEAIEEVVASAAAATLAATPADGIASETATETAAETAAETSSFAKTLVSPCAVPCTRSSLEASVPASTLAGDVPRVFTVFYNRGTNVPVEPILPPPQAAILPPQHVWVAIQGISEAFDMAEVDVQHGRDYGTYAYLNKKTMAALKIITGDRAPKERAPIWVEPGQEDKFLQVGAKRAFANTIAVA
jgi:hypothetical protein